MTTGTRDPYDPRLALRAAGLLADLNRAGVADAAAVHTASRLGALAGETDELALAALALVVRSVSQVGSVCLDLDTIADLVAGTPAAAHDRRRWQAAVLASPLLDKQVLRWEHELLYLDRYWQLEVQLAADLQARASVAQPVADPALLEAALDRLFPDPAHQEQRAAATRVTQRAFTVITGGPGTGKTSTIARLLALLLDPGVLDPGATGPAGRARTPRIALAAPTGKAAARLQEAIAESLHYLPEADRARVGSPTASTLHRLLGWRPDNATRFRHHRGNRLPHDVVIVDEASMVDMTLMARLAEALRDDATLVLVGDADQLPPVQAGAVLADVVAGYPESSATSPVARLVTTHRYGRHIGLLAEAVRAGDADRAVEVLRSGMSEVVFVEVDDAEASAGILRPVLVPHAEAIWQAAVDGDAEAALVALSRHRLLCAHRDGPAGVSTWNRRVEHWLRQATGDPLYDPSYAGRPLLVTSNDYALGLYNGDTGVLVRGPEARLEAVFATASGQLRVAPTRLHDVETMHAMTVHKSQGSQAEEVTVVLPSADSRLLTRELLYTAITRASDRVRLVGSEATVRAAIGRRVQRATGLRHRLT